jgi:hypothetical protein
MALFGLDAGGNSAYVQAAGDGTLSAPYILQHDLLPAAIKSAQLSSTSGTTGYFWRGISQAKSA